MSEELKEAKQVIVVRKDLNMRKGKIAAQAAHASLGAVLKLCANGNTQDGRYYELYAQLRDDSPAYAWLNGPFTKICVSVDSEEELQALVDRAIAEGILFCKITDAGKTEFNGVPTVTCAAFGPAWVEELDQLTGHLKLM